MSFKEQQPEKEIDIKRQPEIEQPTNPEINIDNNEIEIEQPGHAEVNPPDHKEIVETPDIPNEVDNNE